MPQQRGGNRRLNRAVQYAALAQATWEPRAIAYLARKQAEGKTKREALRCLIGGVSGAQPVQESGLLVVRVRDGPDVLPPDGQFELCRPWLRRAQDRLQDIAPTRAVNKAPATRLGPSDEHHDQSE